MSADTSDPRQFNDLARRSLAEFILAIADTKRLLGIRYAEWCDGAPALEAAVAASAMAQDELGHSRALLPLLRDFPEIDSTIPDEAPRAVYHAISFLDGEFCTWPTFVAANVLIGDALTVAVEAARQSRFIPLRTRAVKILEEERFHWLHGVGWFKRLAAHKREGGDLAAKTEEILAQTLCWFGHPDDSILFREGMLDATPDELRNRWLNRVGPLIGKSQADCLVRGEDARWEYASELPWERFDVATRRLKSVES